MLKKLINWIQYKMYNPEKREIWYMKQLFKYDHDYWLKTRGAV